MQDMIERHQVCLPHRCCSRPFRGPETSQAIWCQNICLGQYPGSCFITTLPRHQCIIRPRQNLESNMARS